MIAKVKGLNLGVYGDAVMFSPLYLGYVEIRIILRKKWHSRKPDSDVLMKAWPYARDLVLLGEADQSISLSKETKLG